MGRDLPAQYPVVVAPGRNPFTSMLLVQVGFIVGLVCGLMVISRASNPMQLGWLAVLTAFIGAAVAWAFEILRRGRRAGGVDSRAPRAEIDGDGVTIVDRKGNRARASWADVARLESEPARLVGPEGEPIIEVPDDLIGLDPGFAYTVVKARPDRYALIRPGFAFVPRDEATSALDPDRWRSDRRRDGRIDQVVFYGLLAGVLVLVWPPRTQSLDYAVPAALLVWLAYVIVVRGGVLAWLVRRFRSGAASGS